MPAPANVQELLDLVQKSGVADEGRMRTYMAKLGEQGTVPTDPSKLAGQLVRDGLLTYFQAEQLLQGKWKRFSIGKYKVLERLGSGGMGQVFLCEHKLMRRRVAVKVLPTAKADDKASLARFYREAQAVAAVDHPNLVRAFDIDQEDNLHFLVMEWVDGTNLQDLVKKFGPLDVTRACHYIYGSAVGLQHANEIGLIHRDIKPGNILVDRSGVVKILDMGLARFFHDEVDAITRQYDENVLGTADYLSPEQAIDSHTVDTRADIYSLGATFYYLLTGSAPFPEGSVAQKLIWHQNREPKSVRSLRPEIPEEVGSIIAKMMAKKPEDRYQTPAELMAALAPWVATPIPPPEDKELPQLSPAATGVMSSSMTMRGTTGGLRPMAGSAPTTLSGNPTVIATGSRGSGSITPSPETATGGVWDSLGDDSTQPVVKPESNGSKTPAPKSNKIRPLSTANPGNGKRPILIIAGLLLLLAGAGAGVYFGFIRKGGDQNNPDTPGSGRRLIVTKTGGEGTYKSIGLALRQAIAGDTIVIADERISESMMTFAKSGRDQLKDITVESGLSGGKPAVIELGGVADTMLNLANVDNVRFKNLEFDGQNKAEVGVRAGGVCTGVTFENVTIRGVKQGFLLQSIAAEPGRLFTIERCRFVLANYGDGIAISGQLETRRVTVKNCRFEGPGRSALRFDGPMNDVEIVGNRIFKADTAFAFVNAKSLDGGKLQKLQLTGNTICEVRDGAFFDFAPSDMKGKLDITLARNYFIRTQNVVQVGGPGGAVPGLSFQDNGFGKGVGAGNSNMPNIGAGVPGEPSPPEDQSDDPNFLQFPGSNGPVINGKKVGAGTQP